MGTPILATKDAYISAAFLYPSTGETAQYAPLFAWPARRGHVPLLAPMGGLGRSMECLLESVLRAACTGNTSPPHAMAPCDGSALPLIQQLLDLVEVLAAMVEAGKGDWLSRRADRDHEFRRNALDLAIDLLGRPEGEVC